MPKKLKSAESDNDEQANESSGPGSLFQNEDNAQGGKLDPLSDTTLQDLPIEMIELILIKAIVMEVKGLKLAKCAWKKKADPVISRLRAVCLQWSNILSTDHFQAELHRTLNDTAQDPIRLEVLMESSGKSRIWGVAALKNDIFTLREVCDEYCAIDVYDSDNMEVVTDVIELPKSHAKCMVACNASSSVFLGLRAEDFKYNPLSLLRIWKEAEHQFKKSKWEHVYGRSVHKLSVTANGGLLTFTRPDQSNPASVALHDSNNALLREIFLRPYSGVIRYVIQNSNGNLVVSYDTEKDLNTKLWEISTSGVVVRQFESSLEELSRVSCADVSGRILITQSSRRMELLDSELNLLGVYSLEQDEGKSFRIHDLTYDSERNVLMRCHYDFNSEKNFLTTFRFVEE